tara:strand:- start:171725 stop:173647 length:1923 start_codon:yes stop_codon:yes gene_type:complete
MDGKNLTPQQIKLQEFKQLFPEVFAEGKVDWEKLKATLGEDINFSNERYVLNWAGKSDAFKVLQAPTSKTLIPAKDESVNFDDTENIFIEGENLEVLKVLQKSYFGKVKMIYIDPPYNTGNDHFIYADKFSETKENYEKRVGDKDEEGYMTKDGMFKKNSKENGQYHSNWLNMMYPRLFLAKNLLTQDGIIFISIGDDEIANLLNLANEVFGEENKLATFVWRSDGNIDNQAKVKYCHEYILAYVKNLEVFPHPEVIDPNIDESSKLFKEEIRNTIIKNGVKNPLQKVIIPKGFPANFEKGIIDKSNVNYPKYSNNLEVENFKLKNPVLAESGWSSKRQLELFIESGFNTVLDTKNQDVAFELTENGAIETVKKRKENQSHVISFINNVGTTQSMSSYLNDKDLFFDYPKPVGMINYLISMINDDDFIILDFFAGSGTTAHSVLDLNRDGKKRKFILVQLDEKTDENSRAKKVGYDTISAMTVDRIKMNISEIQNENEISGKLFEKSQDLGFKVLKLSDSNFKQWQQIKNKDAKALEDQMKLFINPVAENATIENMVYELMLKSGKDLNSKIEHKNGFFAINENELILLLEKAEQKIIDSIITLKPKKVVALDKLFKGNDQLKTNTVLQMKEAGIEFKTI